ncbi:MAG: DUF5685 family protein [Lachnospiraceae bacterium]|nr:DUF5685 family protein [Lachnospiraceae bacterium]
MFGYVNINKKELTEENQKIYQSFYCGLCRQLKETAGRKGQMMLNYDMTFLVVLLSGLYELTDSTESFVCGLHPTRKLISRINEATAYAADMNIILSYQNFEDDWRDNRSYSKKAFAKMLGKDYTRIARQYPRQVQAVENYIDELGKAEERGETNIDLISGLTGTMLGEIFAWKEDIWAEELRCMGFYLGKFIYLLDAYEDYEQDRKKNQYNIFVKTQRESGQSLDTFSKLLLTSMISECAKSFERLPIIEYADILRNVLYSGVWTKYEYNRIRRENKKKK